MTMSQNVFCPHCSAESTAAEYCESCGMALPASFPSSPRIIDDKSFATTALGQQIQSEELEKQAKKGAGALLAVAIFQTVYLAILLAAGNARSATTSVFSNGIVVELSAMAIIFWGLYFWARVQPLPAAIVGLVLYGTLVAINVATMVSRAANGGVGANGFAGLGVGWLDIVILVVLGQAIGAGSKYRKMMQANSVPEARN